MMRSNPTMELNMKEMETVAGGDVTFDGCRFSGYVGKYSGTVGQEYYIYDNVNWYRGTLLDSYEADRFLGLSSQRMHKFQVTSWSGNAVDLVYDFSGDDVSLYTTMTKE